MRTYTILALAGLTSAWSIPSDLDLDPRDTELNLPDHMPPAALPGVVAPRDGALVEPTSPWIEVNDNGQPTKTNTPSMTTVSGTPTAINGAPYDLTASVYTWTTWGSKTTSTGTPPNPTATGSGGQGAFARCSNLDGDYAPFCRPNHNSTLLTGNTYYITWDPEYYNKTGSNITYEIAVRLDYLNTTAHVNKYVKLDVFDTVPASWGFWPLKVDSSLLKGKKSNNVTITLLSSQKGSAVLTNSTALPVLIQNPAFPSNPDVKLPTGETLYIALPVGLGTVVLLVCGVCLWNRKSRRIHLGRSVMGRGRGYSGRNVRRSVFRKDHGVQLDSQPLSSGRRGADSPPDGYHDFEIPEMPRRDSDALGSLAGSPVTPTFRDHDQQHASGERNAFRDEMERQRREEAGEI